MWSSVALFVFTFVVLGLLLGFAAVYDSNQQAQIDNSTIQENVTANLTQGSSQPSSAVADEEDSSQITNKDIIDWLVQILSVVIAAVALIYTTRSFKAQSAAIKDESNARYVQIFSTIESELMKLEKQKPGQTNQQQREGWELNFLNFIGRIAYLIEKEKYPIDLADYLKRSFSWARYLIENSPQSDLRRQSYADILDICIKKKWEAINPDPDSK